MAFKELWCEVAMSRIWKQPQDVLRLVWGGPHRDLKASWACFQVDLEVPRSILSLFWGGPQSSLKVFEACLEVDFIGTSKQF